MYGEWNVAVSQPRDSKRDIVLTSCVIVNGVIVGRAENRKKRNARRDAVLQALSEVRWNDEEDEVELMVGVSDEE